MGGRREEENMLKVKVIEVEKVAEMSSLTSGYRIRKSVSRKRVLHATSCSGALILPSWTVKF